MKVSVLAAAAGLAVSAAAHAQSFVNGDFETGDLSGWTVVNTPNGVGAPGNVYQIDMDNPGPLPVSWAAGFQIGSASGSGTEQGIEMTQTLELVQGTTYTIDFDWSSRRGAEVPNDGGTFAVIVNGGIVSSIAAGPVIASAPAIGHFSTSFIAQSSGPATVGIRTTRPFTWTDVFNYVDNVTVVAGSTGGCYANCDESTAAPALNVADFTCFLQRFAAGESYANCDESTTAPALNVADFTCFLQGFAASCP